MKARLLLPLVVAIAATIASAQTDCPMIDVTGPAGIPDPGDLISFSAQITGNIPSGITYKWRVSTGKVAEGQGTERAKFDVGWPTTAKVTATVEVLGLPAGCPNTASETMGVAIDPGPIYVGLSDEPRTHPARVNELIEELEKYPNSQGYIFIGTARSDLYKQIEQLIRATASQAGFDQDRLTIKSEITSKQLVELWVIRPGVDDPLCKDCEDVACPRISISGPAGYIAHGMATIFSINADLPNLENLKYEWTVTAGKVDQGQGTPHLYLITNNEDGGKELKVKVRVTGLSEGCPDTAEFVYGKLQFEGDPIVWDEYGGSLSIKDELGRLDLVAADWKNDPTYIFYFIIYRGPKDTVSLEKARVKRINDRLVLKHRMPTKNIVILSGGIGPRRSTRIYKVPPGADKPTP